MAKILYSAIGITRISGKQQGSIFAFNKYGNYVRNWAKQTYAQKELLQRARVQFVATANTWKTISQKTQQAWDLAAQSKRWGDRLGNFFTPTGYQLYMKRNTNRQTIGLPMLVSPLEETIAGGDFEISSFGVNIGTDDALTFANLESLSISTNAKFYATASFFAVPKGYSQDFGTVKNKYKRFGAAQVNNGFTIDLFKCLEEFMNSVQLEEGQQVYMKVTLYDINGDDYPPLTARAIVQNIDL